MKSNIHLCYLVTVILIGILIVETRALRRSQKYKNVLESLAPETKYSMMREFQHAQLRKQSNTVLTFTRTEFWKLVATTPKNYSIAVLFCDVDLDRNFYKQALANFQLAAAVHYNQFRKGSTKKLGDESHPLFFVNMHIGYATRDEMNKYELEPSVPNFVLFPASNYSKHVPMTKMDFDFQDLLAESEPIPTTLVTDWISEVSGVFLNQRKYSNSEKLGYSLHQLVFFVIIGNVIAIVYKNNGLGDSLIDSTVCAKMIIGLVLWFTSGNMCNMIQHSPFASSSKGGSLRFIAHGFRDQYIVESCIIMGLYACVTMGVIRLIEIEKDPEQVEKRKTMTEDDILQQYLGNCIVPTVFGMFGIMIFYNYKVVMSQS